MVSEREKALEEALRPFIEQRHCNRGVRMEGDCLQAGDPKPCRICAARAALALPSPAEASGEDEELHIRVPYIATGETIYPYKEGYRRGWREGAAAQRDYDRTFYALAMDTRGHKGFAEATRALAPDLPPVVPPGAADPQEGT